jgi:hypothetical protein
MVVIWMILRYNGTNILREEKDVAQSVVVVTMSIAFYFRACPNEKNTIEVGALAGPLAKAHA